MAVTSKSVYQDKTPTPRTVISTLQWQSWPCYRDPRLRASGNRHGRSKGTADRTPSGSAAVFTTLIHHSAIPIDIQTGVVKST